MNAVFTKFDLRLIQIMRDHGYSVVIRPDRKIELSSRPYKWMPGRSIGVFFSVFAAAEYLVPIIHEDIYRNAVNRVGNA